jgi:uncharacterized SAM-binding protein YcdF (DUF218 family)
MENNDRNIDDTTNTENQQDTLIDTPEQEQVSTKRKSSLIGWIWTPIALVLLLAIGTGIGGFVRFAEDVANLKAPEISEMSDAIVVLTGGKSRITEAVTLLKDGKANRLFISGVNPNISDAELIRVSGADKALFACCIDIGKDAKDTIGNGKEIAQWATAQDFKTLIVVTNNYHMRRSLLELYSATSGIELVAYPVMNSEVKTKNWYKDRPTLRTLINEFAKLNLAYFRKYIGVEMAGNLYSEQTLTKQAGI